MIRNLLTLLFILRMPFFSFGQFSVEAQFGGADLLGFSVNTRLEIPLGIKKEHHIAPHLGLGLLAPGYIQPMHAIINTGLHYQYRRIGIGSEIGFYRVSTSAGTPGGYPNDVMDIMLYPNVNYVFGKNLLYYRISAGAYFAYYRNGSSSGDLQFEWDGEIIPGFGISIGYRF